MPWVRSLIIWSDFNPYYRPSFFTHCWIQHKNLNTKIHVLCPTTKFCLRTRISEPCNEIIEFSEKIANPLIYTQKVLKLFSRNFTKATFENFKMFFSLLNTFHLAFVQRNTTPNITINLNIFGTIKNFGFHKTIFILRRYLPFSWNFH